MLCVDIFRVTIDRRRRFGKGGGMVDGAGRGWCGKRKGPGGRNMG